MQLLGWLKSRRRVRPGTAPGVLEASPEALMPEIRVLAYGPEGLEEKTVTGPDALRDFMDRHPVVWVNVAGLGDVETIRQVGQLFGLHLLALEDTVNGNQRPKIEPYEDHLFLVIWLFMGRETLTTGQISLFLGRGVLVSFQDRHVGCFDPVIKRIRDGKGRIRHAGADYLAYALLDAVIDHYYPVLERLGERLEAIEQEILEYPAKDTIPRLITVKRDLQAIRQWVWPLREVLGGLMRDSGQLVSEETRMYLRDCQDHAVQVLDLVESAREHASELINMYMSIVSNNMNNVMKVLTIIATIFIPLTFIAGIYGMNFNPETSPLNMPELNWFWGYPFVLGLMGVTVAGMVVYFRRKGWL